MGEERGVYRVLVGKLEGKRPLGRPRCRWVDNIRMDLQEVGCGYMDWIGLSYLNLRICFNEERHLNYFPSSSPHGNAVTNSGLRKSEVVGNGNGQA